MTFGGSPPPLAIPENAPADPKPLTPEEIEQQLAERRAIEERRRGVDSLSVPLGGVSRAVTGTGLVISRSN